MAIKRPLVLYSGQVQELYAGDFLYHADYLLAPLSPYTVGDLICADSITTLTKLAAVAVGNVLLSAGVSTAPIWGKVDLAAHVSGILGSANGGTGNGFTKFSGPATAEKTFTLPDASATILTSNAAVTAAQGGTGQSSYAVGDLLYASSTSALAKLAAGAVGAYLRGGGVATAPLWSTLILPNAATAFRLPVATAANIIGELAAVGATGEYLKGNTGAIPSWATLNQAAVAGLTTTDGPTFAHLHISDVAAIYTAAESWVGPSSTTGTYFKSNNVGIGTATPIAKFHVFASGTPITTDASDNVPDAALFEGPSYTFTGSAGPVSTNLAIVSNTLAANSGGTLAFGSKYRDGHSFAYFAMIKSGKDNATTDDYGGYLAFGTHTDGSGLAERMRISSTGIVTMSYYGAGTATFDASGNISSASDERLKVILDKYTGGIAQLNGIEPIVHKWNELSGMEMEHEYVGFSAQNVRDNMPEAIYENKEGYLSYSDKALIAALVNTVKQQQAQINAMQARLNQ